MPTELDYLLHPTGALGEWLASKILASPKSIRDIAAEMGTSPSGIKAWVGQGSIPRPVNLQKIADWTGVSYMEVARLAGGQPSAVPSVDGNELGVIRTEPAKTDVGRRLLAKPLRVLQRALDAIEAAEEEGAAHYRASSEAHDAPDPGS